MIRIIIILFGAFSLCLLPFSTYCQPTGTQESVGDTLTVRGNAEVSAAPDRAIVQLGAVAEGKNAIDAQKEVSEKVTAVLKAVTATGISAEKITTTELTLVPLYEQSKRMPPDQKNSERIIGYKATHMIRVEIAAMDKIGDVIDAAMDAGANRVEQLYFQLADDTTFRKRALREAALSAREKARELADALNLRLVRIMDVSEEGVHLIRPQFRIQPMAALNAESTPVQPGQIQVSASVVITYRIESSRASDAE